MGDFQAGKWIIGIVVYYVIFFLIVSSIFGLQAKLGASTTGVSFSGAGFEDKFNAFEEPVKCEGRGRAMNYFGRVLCTQLDVQEDNATCQNISGCSWRNETSIFGFAVLPAQCNGIVNNSFYNITDESRAGYCASSGLQTEGLCTTFKCPWINNTDMGNQQTQALEFGSVGNIWESVKFVTGFKADFGFNKYDWLLRFLFSWLPFMMLLIALYFSAPFAH